MSILVSCGDCRTPTWLLDGFHPHLPRKRGLIPERISSLLARRHPPRQCRPRGSYPELCVLFLWVGGLAWSTTSVRAEVRCSSLRRCLAEACSLSSN